MIHLVMNKLFKMIKDIVSYWMRSDISKSSRGRKLLILVGTTNLPTACYSLCRLHAYNAAKYLRYKFLSKIDYSKLLFMFLVNYLSYLYPKST